MPVDEFAITAALADELANPLAGAPNVRAVFRIGADRRDPQKRREFIEGVRHAAIICEGARGDGCGPRTSAALMIRLAVTTLLTVPNISEGRDHAVIEAIAPAFGLPVLSIHSDPDHHRTVFTVAGGPGELAPAVAAAAHMATATIDISAHDGIHPRIGALDVAPIVFLAEEDRGAACAEALVLADRLGEELELPVFLYGILAGGRSARRAPPRRADGTQGTDRKRRACA